MDTDFLALAERPMTRPEAKPFSVLFKAFTDEHVRTIELTMNRLNVLPIGRKLVHRGLEINFADEADAALVKLAVPPLRT